MEEGNGLAKPLQDAIVEQAEEGVGQRGNGDVEVARLELEISIDIEVGGGAMTDLWKSTTLIMKRHK